MSRKSIEIDPELTQIIKLSDKEINIVMITVLQMFKKLNRDIDT